MRTCKLVLVPMVMTLVACGDDPAPPAVAPEGADVQGEIRGGTISDAMIPTDSLRSQSPPAVEASDAAEDEGSE